MDTEPFDNFAAKLRSYELLEAHRRELRAQAEQLLRAKPDAEPVGLVVDSDAPEAAPIVAEIERAEGRPFKGGYLLALATRHSVVTMIRENFPASIEWLPPSAVAGRRVLPITAITAAGIRFCEVELE